MKQRPRIYYTEAQRALMWGRLLGKNTPVIVKSRLTKRSGWKWCAAVHNARENVRIFDNHEQL